MYEYKLDNLTNDNCKLNLIYDIVLMSLYSVL